MTMLCFGLPAILVLAAVATPARGQDAASQRPYLHQSGCIDFSAEYEGCLSLAYPSEAQVNADPDRPINPQMQRATGHVAPMMEPRFSTSSGSKASRRTDPVPATISTSDWTAEVGTAVGHLGAP
jgi:hypothetical protein